MKTNKQQCVGYIQLVHADTASNQVITLGGAGFVSHAEDAATWAGVPSFDSETNLMADRLDGNRDIVGGKPVSAQTYVQLMGATIADLAAASRDKLVTA